MNTITVDFSKVTGAIKPLHGVCCAPYIANQGPSQATIKKYFEEAHIPYCRLHDCCGAYGGAHFVDIPNIFPDFDADENDPENYDFYYTDEYITGIQQAGAEAYYRLGITIEWGSKKYTTGVPKDMEKWARICEHVVRHYNEGWADGFHYKLKYWEIWNEPENPGNAFGSSMWAGTKEEFFRLYEITAKHLKKAFPDILVGGYGSCGFYAITREKLPQTHKAFVPYFTDFLTMCKETQSPLDFFSWHIYTGDEKELLAHAKYVRETLDAYGYTKTESHLNEWNIHAEGRGFPSKHTLEGASFNAAVLSALQNTSYVDKAMYYCFSSRSLYNGFFNQNDGSVDPPWYSYVAFGHLYMLRGAVETKSEGNLYATSAKDERDAAVLISNFKAEDGEVTLRFTGLGSGKTAHLLRLCEGKNLEETEAFSVPEAGEIRFHLEEQSAVLIKFE